ncbi:MAG: glycoside hydrolase family 97 catalytic domain-containing protein [Tannerella sp.]|jgi:alpha-glucosidase|nr:glycoside hydrolase family 97 catalytic domain-containing protein [Tannerella sp.]
MKKNLSFIILALGLMTAMSAPAQAKTAKPQTIAHRGYWQTEGSAQNSLTSLRKAQEVGVYGAEFDVWLTTDGVIVLNHDGVINGVSIQDTTYQAIKDFTLSNGERIPTLEDYLKTAKANQGIKLILEIKTHKTLERNRAVTAACVKMVNAEGMAERVEYISFSIDVCRELVRLAPDEEVSYLAGNPSAFTVKELKDMKITGIDYHFSLFRSHPEYVEQAHALGMTVNAWTANVEAEYTDMAKLGVDFITTDKPEEVLKMKPQTITAKAAIAKSFTIKSPDGKLNVIVDIGKTVSYSVVHESDIILSKSDISMSLSDGRTYGVNPKLVGSNISTVNTSINATVYKKAVVTDNYRELKLLFAGDYSIIFRAYNDGAAYRFTSSAKQAFTVESEQAEFNFPANRKAYIAYGNISENTPLEKQYMQSFEQTYAYVFLSDWNKKRLGITPVAVETTGSKKVVITEADLTDYPGMFLYPSKPDGLKGVFAPFPKDVHHEYHLQSRVDSRESYLAKRDGAGAFPWRVIIVAEKDADLANSDMVYRLATPSEGDYSWVKPGKAAWDWWHDWNIYGVDFRAGVNNDTYKYYVDFAAQYGLEYFLLDASWAVSQADLFKVQPGVDLKEIVEYAAGKNVRLILWVGYYAFDKDMEKVCKYYSELGYKGFKIDFMDRDDQVMVDFHRRAAEMGAKYKLLIDFHGTYKPTGLHRTYPNVINFEGVNGLEQLKWAAAGYDQVTYDVSIPFIRQVAGPMDYTQGAMRNATRGNFKAINSEPMSQGTRCHQLAEYIVFESPLSMLCDNPASYRAEDECTRLIASIPTVWDETRVLNGEIGRYVTIARRRGNEWFIGSLNGWEALSLELDLSFLGEGSFTGEVFRDGINAARAARDYKRETITIPTDRKVTAKLAPGGGYVMRVTVEK